MPRLILNICVLAVLLAQHGCLKPSGTPRDPNSDDAQRQHRNQPRTDPPQSPAKPGSDNPDPGKDDPPHRPTWNLALSIVSKKPGDDDVYKNQVRPIIDRSCTAGGCHAASEVIDLRSFPFPFEGSYTMDDVTAQLGADYDPAEAQKIVVRKLIESVEDDYMPPGGVDVPLVTAEELNSFRTWLDSDLKIITNEISATIGLTGTDGAKEVCTITRPLKTDLENLSLGSKECPDLSTLTYTISSQDGVVLSSGSWSIDELIKISSARIEFEL